MRSSTLLLAGPLAASAQVLTTITGRVQTATISSGSEVLYTTTWTYSNPATNYLSETNSVGVVTGQPSGSAATAGQPEAVTSQPAVATIPAGLPTGETYIAYNGTAGFTSFQVSVGSSTTVVVGAAATVNSDGTVQTSGSASSSSGSGSGNGGSGGSSGNSGNSGSGSSNGGSSASGSAASASASESGNAASSVRVAGAGIGLFAFIAALL